MDTMVLTRNTDNIEYGFMAQMKNTEYIDMEIMPQI